MAYSKSFNKKTGVTYVYEVLENHWDKEKGYPVSKRKLIGKIDPETGEIVPTRKRAPKPKPAEAPVETDSVPVSVPSASPAPSSLAELQSELDWLLSLSENISQRIESVKEKISSLS